MNSMNNDLNGWLVINKDLGMTSRQVVNIVKKTLNVKKIGHAGTLDPLATGVLALAIGKATKTVKYIMDGMKKYSFTIKWGISTDTQDAEGKITSKSNKKPDEIKLKAILKNLVGEMNQIPPKFSAIKIKGKRAYELARNGKKFTLKSRKVFLKKIEIVEKNVKKIPCTSFEIECGKGFYVRSLVRDICKKLDVDGHVIELKRIESKPFNLKSSISIKDFLRLYEKNDWKNFFLPIYSVLNKIKYVGK
jgi:tRNA pseudouridine55 synthase